jgi:prepilin-type N-terminal cleavage/methylation domain-containing protein
MQIRRKYRCQSTQGGEAGFTFIEMIIVMVLASILGIFLLQIVTKSLSAQIAMQKRKERADDAVLVLERISREVREAKSVSVDTTNDILKFEKNIPVGEDTNEWVRFVLDSSNLMRQSAGTDTALNNLDSDSGNILAKNVSSFSVSEDSNVIYLVLEFSSGSHWQTRVFPRN